MNEDIDDEVIGQLRDAVSGVMDSIDQEQNSDRAALVIGAKEILIEGEYQGIQTFVDICGDYGILGEALYTEMMSQISDNNPGFFNLLREVVKTIEQELELKDDEPLQEDRTLH